MTTTPSTGLLSYSDRYAAISARLMREAQRELDLGDLVQSAEKAWGAAAHAIKSVAEKWGWYHQGHYRLNATVAFIAHQWGMKHLLSLYATPTILHSNYYEHELDGTTLQVHIDITKTFVGEMEKIRAEAVPVFPPPESLPRDQGRLLRLLTTAPRDDAPRSIDISLLPPVEPEPPESR